MADKGCREASYWGLHLFIFFIYYRTKKKRAEEPKKTSESGCKDALV